MKLPPWVRTFSTKGRITVHVPESLRGWSVTEIDCIKFMKPNIALTDCPTGRILFIHEKKKEDKESMRRFAKGDLVHRLFRAASDTIRGKQPDLEAIVDDVNKKYETSFTVDKFFNYFKKFKSFFEVLERHRVRWETEKRLDGAFLGITEARADLVIYDPLMVVELKTGGYAYRNVQEPTTLYQLTLYALLIERETGRPADVGVVMDENLRFVPLPLGAKLRREVLRLIMQKDVACRSENIPPICNMGKRQRCPYTEVCMNV